MNDVKWEDPSVGFTPAPPPPIGGEPPPPKKKGGRRGPRAPKPDKKVKRKQRGQTAAALTSPTPGYAPHSSKKPRAVKIDLTLAMSALAGLQPDDANVFQTVLHMLQQLPAKARTRVVTALAKVVA